MQIDGETMETVTDFIFLGSKITMDGNCSHKIKRHMFPGRKAMTNLDNVLKRRDIRDITLLSNILYSQSYGFSSSHKWMWELDHKEGQVLKNGCFWIVVLETFESPLDCKKIKPVNCKWSQHWIFIERADAEAPIFWWPNARNWFIRKHLILGKVWERLKAGRECVYRGWDGWMASLTQWTWVWATSKRWWRTGKHDVLHSMDLQIVKHDWVSEQQQISSRIEKYIYIWKNMVVNNMMIVSGTFNTDLMIPEDIKWDLA